MVEQGRQGRVRKGIQSCFWVRVAALKRLFTSYILTKSGYNFKFFSIPLQSYKRSLPILPPTTTSLDTLTFYLLPAHSTTWSKDKKKAKMGDALASCVSSLRASNNLLASSISILDSGVSDFPRLGKVLQTTRVWILSRQIEPIGCFLFQVLAKLMASENWADCENFRSPAFRTPP